MRSTFMGLETSKRGLFTQQSALYTVGHNIDNANTLGYSRQRVNMQATAGFPGIGLNTPTMPGFLGTGVEAGSIQRIRDSFVDQQFRQETNKLGYWESRSKAISQMEDVLTEPSDYGLQKSLSEFWQSLNDLAVNPDNSGARAVVVQRGIAVADSFNYMHRSLKDIQTNLGTEIGVATDDINDLLQQIAQLNDQIKKVEPNGYLPNDLYDARDLLLDQLSTYIPIETERVPSGGRALKIAEGSLTVSLKLADGTKLTLIEGNKHVEMRAEPNPLVKVEADGTVTNQPIEGMYISNVGEKLDMNATATPTHSFDQFTSIGKLKSLMDSYGTPDGKGLYPEMLAELNKMALAFAEEFNRVHESGTDLEGNKGQPFFVVKGTTDATNLTAANMYVNEAIVQKPELLAASDSAVGAAEEGNGNNAKKLAGMQFTGLASLGGATIQTYFQGIIGKLGVDGRQAERLQENTETLLVAVERRRASISSVSLDEEMTDMIKFQQAYNASARMITAIDETLDKIINGMGRVGL